MKFYTNPSFEHETLRKWKKTLVLCEHALFFFFWCLINSNDGSLRHKYTFNRETSYLANIKEMHQELLRKCLQVLERVPLLNIIF